MSKDDSDGKTIVNEQDDNGKITVNGIVSEGGIVSENSPESAILHAMAAYDNLGRRMVMEQRGEMTKTQVDALMALNLFGCLTMTQISNHLAVSKEQATRTISPLVDQGLLKRTRRLDNQRIVEVSLTELGKNLINESWKQVLQTLDKQLAPLTMSERTQLINASQQALDVLRKLLYDPH